MIDIVQFAPWHVECMDLNGIDIGTEFTGRVASVNMLGPAVTILHDQRPLAAIGCIIICRGTAEVWILADRDVRHIAKSFYKTARWCIQEAQRRYRLVRLTAAIAAENVVNRRWAERLGFKPEGDPMLKFGPKNETYIRYVLLA